MTMIIFALNSESSSKVSEYCAKHDLSVDDLANVATKMLLEVIDDDSFGESGTIHCGSLSLAVGRDVAPHLEEIGRRHPCVPAEERFAAYAVDAVLAYLLGTSSRVQDATEEACSKSASP